MELRRYNSRSLTGSLPEADATITKTPARRARHASLLMHSCMVTVWMIQKFFTDVDWWMWQFEMTDLIGADVQVLWHEKRKLVKSTG